MSESASEYSAEVIKEGVINYRRGSFGRWKKETFRLCGNGVLYTMPEKKKSKVVELSIVDSVVSSGEGLTGKKNTISIITARGSQYFLKLEDSSEYNSWFHLLTSYTRRNSLNSFELSDDGVVICSVKGEIITANSALVEIFGYEDKSELLGKHAEILMPIPVAKIHGIYMSRYEKGGTPRLVGKQREMMGKKKDGTEIPILLSLGELSSGDSRNFIATIKDLSRSKISKSKADVIVEKVQTNLRNAIEEHSRSYQSLVSSAIESELHNIIQSSQKVKDELFHANEEIISLTRKTNQQSTVINTFKAICDEPTSMFGVSYLAKELSSLIQKSSEAETLFRIDSLVTRHLTLLAMLYGGCYLDRILSPFISNILSQKKSFEINPHHKLSHDDSLQRRITRLKNETSSILHCIFHSIEYLPMEICQLTNCLYESTKEKFPGYEHSISGGFLLLRFICPAIISPESFGLNFYEPSEIARRNLILISKYIQYAANGNDVEDDNPMAPLRDTLSQHIIEMKSFIDDVSKKGSHKL